MKSHLSVNQQGLLTIEQCRRTTVWESWCWVMQSFHQGSPYSLIQDTALVPSVVKVSSAYKALI